LIYPGTVPVDVSVVEKTGAIADLTADPAAGGWSGAAGHPLRGGSILFDVLVALSRFPPSGSGDMASGNDRHNQLNLVGLSAGT
jgi:hypothetical protein